MKPFKIAYNILVRLLFPMFLQGEIMLAYINALIAPVKRLKNEFNSFCDENIYKIEHTSQVCYLQAAINDRYDEGLRRIKVVDGATQQPLYIFQVIEQKPVYIYLESENNPVYLYQESEYYGSGEDFIVEVPNFIDYDINEFRALVLYYRLPSKSFKIVKV